MTYRANYLEMDPEMTMVKTNLQQIQKWLVGHQKKRKTIKQLQKKW